MLKRAIDLDPKFAPAYTGLATVYANYRQWEPATEYAEKGYQLRERTSEREKMLISYTYYAIVPGTGTRLLKQRKCGGRCTNVTLFREAFLLISTLLAGNSNKPSTKLVNHFAWIRSMLRLTKGLGWSSQPQPCCGR
jgi:hypothetical protein